MAAILRCVPSSSALRGFSASLGVLSPKACSFTATRYFASQGSRVIEVTDDEHYKKEVAAAGSDLVVVDFTAAWCGPCRHVAPVYDALSVEFENVKFLKVDIDNDESQHAVMDNNVRAVPTFSFIKDSALLKQLQGADPVNLKATVEQLSK